MTDETPHIETTAVGHPATGRTGAARGAMLGAGWKSLGGIAELL